MNKKILFVIICIFAVCVSAVTSADTQISEENVISVDTYVTALYKAVHKIDTSDNTDSNTVRTWAETNGITDGIAENNTPLTPENALLMLSRSYNELSEIVDIINKISVHSNDAIPEPTADKNDISNEYQENIPQNNIPQNSDPVIAPPNNNKPPQAMPKEPENSDENNAPHKAFPVSNSSENDNPAEQTEKNEQPPDMRQNTNNFNIPPQHNNQFKNRDNNNQPDNHQRKTLSEHIKEYSVTYISLIILGIAFIFVKLFRRN